MPEPGIYDKPFYYCYFTGACVTGALIMLAMLQCTECAETLGVGWYIIIAMSALAGGMWWPVTVAVGVLAGIAWLLSRLV